MNTQSMGLLSAILALVAFFYGLEEYGKRRTALPKLASKKWKKAQWVECLNTCSQQVMVVLILTLIGLACDYRIYLITIIYLSIWSAIEIYQPWIVQKLNMANIREMSSPIQGQASMLWSRGSVEHRFKEFWHYKFLLPGIFSYLMMLLYVLQSAEEGLLSFVSLELLIVVNACLALMFTYQLLTIYTHVRIPISELELLSPENHGHVFFRGVIQDQQDIYDVWLKLPSEHSLCQREQPPTQVGIFANINLLGRVSIRRYLNAQYESFIKIVSRNDESDIKPIFAKVLVE